MAVSFPPSVWLFPITMAAFLSVGLCFTAKTTRLHKLDSGKSVCVPAHFPCRRQGSNRTCLKQVMTVKKKRITVFERKHNLGCLFVPFLNLFNSKTLECFCSAVQDLCCWSVILMRVALMLVAACSSSSYLTTGMQVEITHVFHFLSYFCLGSIMQFLVRSECPCSHNSNQKEITVASLSQQMCRNRGNGKHGRKVCFYQKSLE